jgi:sugar-specific transcriptional regulator TrmB
MIEEILIENGMSAKEAKLYLAVLEAGETTLARAAERAKLKRSTVYSLTNDMKQRGFLAETKRQGISYVSALPPKLLTERFEHAAEKASSILPQLIDLSYASPVKPRIRFYEGIQGIKDILLDAAESSEDYIGFIDYALMPREIYRHIRTKVAPARAKLGNHLQLLMPRNEVNTRVLADYRQKVEHRMVDFPSRKNHIEILLYEGSKIGCMSFVKNEMFGVVINSEAIFVTLKDLFTLIWEQAGKRGKEN